MQHASRRDIRASTTCIASQCCSIIGTATEAFYANYRQSLAPQVSVCHAHWSAWPLVQDVVSETACTGAACAACTGAACAATCAACAACTGAACTACTGAANCAACTGAACTGAACTAFTGAAACAACTGAACPCAACAATVPSCPGGTTATACTGAATAQPVLAQPAAAAAGAAFPIPNRAGIPTCAVRFCKYVSAAA